MAPNTKNFKQTTILFNTIQAINSPRSLLTQKHEIADQLAKHFYAVSSTQKYPSSFLPMKIDAEKHKLIKII